MISCFFLSTGISSWTRTTLSHLGIPVLQNERLSFPVTCLCRQGYTIVDTVDQDNPCETKKKKRTHKQSREVFFLFQIITIII